MEVEFESSEQLAAFKRMQASHPEALGRLLDQGERLQARMVELDGLQSILNHCKGSVHVTANDHTTGYETVSKYFENRARVGEEFDDDDKAAIARCIAADAVLEIQAYPDTPIGSYVCFDATLGKAVATMLVALGLPKETNR